MVWDGDAQQSRRRSTDGAPAAETLSNPSHRGPGRPRLWATEADRKRAYRERLAADVAEPTRLRRELKEERRASAHLRREVSRLTAALQRTDSALLVAREHEQRLDEANTFLHERIRTLSGLLEQHHLSVQGSGEHPTTDAPAPRE
jgi:hypothetical protein